MNTQGDVFFVDFLLDSNKSTNDAIKVENEKAILESIKNILYCEPGERPFYPEFGCNLKKYLFNLLDPSTLVDIHDEIYNSLKRFEPRISEIEVEVVPNYEKDDVEINISFIVIGSNKRYTLRTSIKKIR